VLVLLEKLVLSEYPRKTDPVTKLEFFPLGQALRSALFYVVLVVSVIIWASLVIVISPFLPFHKRYVFAITWWSRFITRALSICCNITYRVEGLENIPAQACIVYSNHQSTWETFFLQTLFYPQATVIKKELLSIPFFGWGFSMVSPIAIDRSDRKNAMQQVMEQGSQRLKDGIWVMIFPEGTRVDAGQRKPFSHGGARLALASGAPLLPIAHNAGEHWPNNRFLKYPGEIRVVIGAPIWPEGKSEAELTAEGERWINATVDRISHRGQASDALLGAPESRV